MVTIAVDDDDETSDHDRATMATANDEELARQLQVSVAYKFLVVFCKYSSPSCS